MQYKGSSTKTQETDESIPLPVCINATEVNDNVTSNNNENYPWSKETICTSVDSIISDLQLDLFSQKHKVQAESFSDANFTDMHGNIKPIL